MAISQRFKEVVARVTADQSVRELAALKEDPDYPIIMLAASTGLRPGEVFGLRWADVDLQAGRLQVRSAVEESRSHGLRLKEPKTERGKREIVLIPDAIAALVQHRGKQAEIRLALGPAWEDMDLVFPGLLGRIANPGSFGKRWREIRTRLGYPTLQLYDLRHGFGSQLLQGGASLAAVSEIMGHSSTAITAAVYLHSLPGDKEKSAAIMERALRSPGK